jgi:hypothetical protein
MSNNKCSSCIEKENREYIEGQLYNLFMTMYMDKNQWGSTTAEMIQDFIKRRGWIK